MGQITPNIGIYIPAAGETNYDNSFAAGMLNVDAHDHSGGPNKGVPIASGGLADGSVTYPKLNANVADVTTGIGVNGALPNQLQILGILRNLYQLATATGFIAKNGAAVTARTFQDSASLTWTNPAGVAGDPSAVVNPNLTLTSLILGAGTALTDYVEGNFVPTMVGEGVAGVTTYTAQNGYYTRIGNIVIVSVTVFGPNATGTGNILFNLPFVVKNQVGGNGISSVMTAAAVTYPAGTTGLALFCVPGTATARVYASGTGVAGGNVQLANVAYNWQFTAIYQI